MKNKVKIIVITGAESTGKSTLSRALADHFNVPFIPEYARDYIQDIGRDYTYNDVEFIAQHQIKQLNELLKQNHPFVILDTWLLITKVWFEEVFQKVPGWLEEHIENTPVDMFLICDTDLPWVADEVRENGGENREILQQKYINQIKKHTFNYELICGIHNERSAKAIEIISKL